jgi:cyclohexa-1,5-dienecarbonyl-CoA hydratase
MPGFRTILVDRLEGDAVLRLTLNQPKGNVLTGEMMHELGSALREHRDQRRLRLVVIRGAGGNFSFGASIEEHRRDRVRAMLGTFHGFTRELAAYPVPVAAFVEGRCLGGAFELALCCHLVVATPSARFGCPEIKLGVFPPVLAAIGAFRLPGALAERLLLTGDEIDADTAGRVGLLAAILDGTNADTAFLDWYRQRLAPLSAFALRQATAAFRRHSRVVAALNNDLPLIERQYLDEVVSSHDGNEGIEAFLARRGATWEDA